MNIFIDYLNILSKCHSLEIENKSFLPFIQTYPEYSRYYNYGTGEFDSENFLYEILQTGIVNLLDKSVIQKKERTNILNYIWTLVEMENSYLHVAYCLPIILEHINHKDFIDEYLGFLLSEPHNIEDIGNERYVNSQSNVIDYLASVYPESMEKILKKYKFDMFYDTINYTGSNTPDYSESLQYLRIKHYLKFLKNRSIFLKEMFPCTINYNI
jgi:hypothetical protein